MKKIINGAWIILLLTSSSENFCMDANEKELRALLTNPTEFGLSLQTPQDAQALRNTLLKELRLKAAKKNIKRVQVSAFKRYLNTEQLTQDEKQNLLDYLEDIEKKGSWWPNLPAIGLHILDTAIIGWIPVFVKLQINDTWIEDAYEILANYSKECSSSPITPTNLPDVIFGLFTAVAGLNLIDNVVGCYKDHGNQFYTLEEMKIALNKYNVIEEVVEEEAPLPIHDVSSALTERELKNRYDQLEKAIKAFDGKEFKQIIHELSPQDIRTLQQKTTDNPAGFCFPSLSSLINTQGGHNSFYSSLVTGPLQALLGIAIFFTVLIDYNDNTWAPAQTGTYANGCYLKNGTWLNGGPPWNEYNEAISPVIKSQIGLLVGAAAYLALRHFFAIRYEDKKDFHKRASLKFTLEEALKKLDEV